MLTRTLWTLALIGLLGGPLRADEPEALVWRGCEVSLHGFMRACAASYTRETKVRIRLLGGGATEGLEATSGGGADLGGSCRFCLPRARERELMLTIVAWDAVVVGVYSQNPVEGISLAQLRKVLKQEITSWDELGGDKEKIVVICRKSAISGVGVMARLLIFGDAKARFGKTVIRLNRSSASVEELVSEEPRALGLSGFASARRRDLKLLAVDGVVPTRETIAAGRYRLVRPLYLVTRKTPSPRAAAFRRWMLSKEGGQAVIRRQGGVNLETGRKLILKATHLGNEQQISNLTELRDAAKRQD